MDEGEDWLMRPILRGLLPYKALDDHSYSLADFVFINESLDVEAENQHRAHVYAMKQQAAKGKK